MVRYSTYADDVSVLGMGSTDVREVSEEIERYEGVSGAKINREKLVGLRLGSWKGSTFPVPFSWTDGP